MGPKTKTNSPLGIDYIVDENPLDFNAQKTSIPVSFDDQNSSLSQSPPSAPPPPSSDSSPQTSSSSESAAPDRPPKDKEPSSLSTRLYFWLLLLILLGAGTYLKLHTDNQVARLEQFEEQRAAHAAQTQAINDLVMGKLQATNARIDNLIAEQASIDNLEVTGATTLNELATTLATIRDTLNVGGHTDLSSLYVHGATILDGTTNFNDDVAIHAPFFVSGETNLTDLILSGQLRLTGNVSDGILIQATNQEQGNSEQNVFTIRTATGQERLSIDRQGNIVTEGSTVISGSLSVSQDTALNANATISENLRVQGLTTLDRATTIGSQLTVGGATTLNNVLTVSDATSLGSTLTVTDATNLLSALTTQGQATFTATPTGNLVNQGSIHINPTSANPDDTLFGASVNGAQKLRIDADGNIYANNAVFNGSVTQGDTTLSNLTVLDNTILGTSDVDTATINATTTITAPTTMQSTLSVQGTTTLATLVTVGDVEVGGEALVSGELVARYITTTNASDTSAFQGHVLVGGTLTAQDILTVTGAATFNSNLSVAGTTSLTGTATLQSSLTVGSNTLFVDPATDRVGVGTGLPGASLHVVNNGTEDALRIGDTTTRPKFIINRSGSGLHDGFAFTVDGDGSLRVAQNNDINERYMSFITGTRIVNFAGSVGIGTASPAQKLHVLDSANSSTGAASFVASGSSFVGTVVNVQQSTRGDSSAYNLLNIQNSSGSALFIRGDRYIGIGTTSPAYKLDVSGGTGIVGQFSGRVVGGEAVNTNEFTTLNQLNTTASGTNFIQNGTSLQTANFNISGNGFVGGNVGIGTTSPAQKLHVLAPGSDGLKVEAGNARLFLDSTTAAADAGEWMLQASSAGNFSINTFNDARTATSNVLTITRSGATPQYAYFQNVNVGIGTTTPQKTLDILTTNGGGLRVGLAAALNQTVGTYFAADNDGIMTAKGALLFEKITSNGVGSLHLAVNGALDNTEVALADAKLTINSSGNVGIGTGSPNGLLHTYRATGENSNYIETGDSSVAGLRFRNSAIEWRTAIQATDDYIIRDVTNSVSAFTVQAATGYVGIGTTNPSYKLDVSGGTGIVAQFSGRVVGGEAVNTNEFTTLNQLNTAASGTNFIQNGTSLQTANFNISGNGFFGGNVGIGTTVPEYALDVRGRGQYNSNTGVTLLTLNQRGTGDILNLQDNGTTVVTVLDGGNVGIGITSPGALLHVGGVIRADAQINLANNSGLYFRNGGNTSWRQAVNWDLSNNIHFGDVGNTQNSNLNLYAGGSGGINLLTNGSNKVVILNNGNVGIDTALPGIKLHVASASNSIARFESTGSASSFIDFTNTTTAGTLTRVGDISGRLALYTSGSEKFTITTAGNVGIGTTSPGEKLEVNVGTNENFAISSDFSWPTGATSPTHGLGFTRTSDNIYVNFIFSEGTNAQSLGIKARNDIHFYGAATRNVSFLESGSVGIGTAGPNAKLHVQGAVGSAIPAIGAGTVAVFDRSAATNSQAFVSIIAGNAAVSTGINFGDAESETSGQLYYNHATDALLLGTAGTTKLTVLSGGNVGIGTSSPVTRLDVNQTSAASYVSTGLAYASQSSDVMQVRNDSTVGDYASLHFSSLKTGGNAAGRIALINGASGRSDFAFLLRSSDHTASTDEKLRITHDGKVGIGTAIPGYRLQVGADTSAIDEYLAIGSSGVANSGLLFRRAGNTDASIKVNSLEDMVINYAESDIANKSLHFRRGSAGTAVATFDSAGNFGIGTTSPATLLHVGAGAGALTIPDGVGTAFTPKISVQEASGVAGISVGVGDGTNLRRAGLFVDQTNAIWGLSQTHSTGAIPFVIRMGSSERLRIDTAGNIGIGTTSPSNKLHVVETLSTNIAGAVFDFSSTGGEGSGVLIDGGGTNGGKYILNLRDAANNERVRFLANGNVGIGTTSPVQNLHVSGSTSTFRLERTGANANHFDFNMANQGGSFYDLDIKPLNDSRVSVRNAAGTAILSVQTTTNNVGIGTTAPGSPLEVQYNSTTTSGVMVRNINSAGQARLSLWQSGGADPTDWQLRSYASGQFGLFNNTDSVGALYADVNGRISVGSDTTPDYQLEVIGSSGSGYFGISSAGEGDILTVNSGGLVGLGTTNPETKLDINNGQLSIRSTGTQLRIFDTAAPDPTDYFTAVYNSDQLLWRYRDVSAATWTDILNLEASGNVGIGTVNPSTDLDIAGTTGLTVGVATPSIENAGILTLRRRDLTITPNNNLGRIDFSGDAGAANTVGASIRAYSKYDWAAGDNPTYLALYTTADNTSTLSERLRVAEDGNVGIGTSSPAVGLHIKDRGSVSLALQDISDTAQIQFRNNANTDFSAIGLLSGGISLSGTASSNTNPHLFVNNSGDVGIGTTAQNSLLDVNGQVRVRGTNKLVFTNTNTTAYLQAPASTITRLGNDEATGRLEFYTNSAERVRIDSSGYVGIGSTNPNALLTISGATPAIQLSSTASTGSHWDFYAQGSAGTLSIREGLFGSSPANRLVFNAGGNISIGKSTANDKLDVDGDIRVGTGTDGCVKDADATVIAGTCSSDLRLKQNIATHQSILDKMSQMRVVTYNWRNKDFPQYHFGTKQQTGLIAQEVEQLFPELVSRDANGYKTINHSALTYYNLQALTELSALVGTDGTSPTFKDLNVSGNTVISGKLQVKSDATFDKDVLVKGTLTVKKLRLEGPIVSTAPAVTIQPGATLGTNSAAKVSGTDTAGTITLTAGDQATLGEIARIIMQSKVAEAEPRITLTARNAEAASLRLFAEFADNTLIVRTIDAPQAGTEYVFDYQVIYSYGAVSSE